MKEERERDKERERKRLRENTLGHLHSLFHSIVKRREENDECQREIKEEGNEGFEEWCE